MTWPGTQSGDAVRITTANASRGADIAARQRRYLISMGFRTVCFVAAIFVTLTWARVLLIIARVGAAVRGGRDGECRGFEIRRICAGQRANRRDRELPGGTGSDTQFPARDDL